MKWPNISGKKFSLRGITNNDLKVPEIHPNTFKTMTKDLIWQTIPSF
jgi:hypothetical protein